jgi:hypothetical protein
MKMFRYFVLAVLVLGLSGAAHAVSFRLLDPSGTQPTFPGIDVTGTNPFSFYDCVVVSADGCWGAVNNTSATITSFSATITADVPLTSLDCPTDDTLGLPSAFTDAPVCNFAGDTMTVVFSGGPGVLKGSTIWIVETGLPDTDFEPDAGSFTVTTAPEPNSIWMALTSLGPLGYVVRRRRRVS